MELPTLYTQRLIIRPLSILDADDMYEYAKTPYVGPTAGWPPHSSVQETISVIKTMTTIKTPYELGSWAIVLKSSNKMIGTIELYRIEVGTFVDNYQSQRVCEKLGFIKEGIARSGYVRYDGKIFDKLIFGMTNEEYLKIYK